MQRNSGSILESAQSSLLLRLRNRLQKCVGAMSVAESIIELPLKKKKKKEMVQSICRTAVSRGYHA